MLLPVLEIGESLMVELPITSLPITLSGVTRPLRGIPAGNR
jgi:hypothetical protein